MQAKLGGQEKINNSEPTVQQCSKYWSFPQELVLMWMPQDLTDD